MLTTIVVLADFQADQAPHNTGPDFGKASPTGLLVIVLLLLGTVLLIRSMNRQLKKVPESFDRENPAPDQAADEGSPPELRGDRKLGEAECSGSPPELDVDQPADREGPPDERDG